MNPSFEEYYDCPTSNGEIEKCVGLLNPCLGTPDYFNSCSNNPDISPPNVYYGFQSPRSGNAYIGISYAFQLDNTGKEYVQLSLTESLEAYKKYHFSIFVSMAEYQGYSSNFIQFKFSDVFIYYNNVYLSDIMTPDITIDNLDITIPGEWVKVEFDYIAHGGEKYVIFGNFNPISNNDCYYVFTTSKTSPSSMNRSYFYFDDASLIKIDETNSVEAPNMLISPPTCTQNGTATISNYDASYTYTFSPLGPTVNANGEISGMVVGTEYTVTATNGTSTSDVSESFSIQGQTPPPPAPIIESPQTFCQGATASNLQPFSSEYHWFLPDNSALNPNDILSSGTYSVSQTIGECESEKAIVEVIISAPPMITVSSDTSICRGESITLTASGANTYSWSPQNQLGSSISVSPNVTTTYTVTGTTAEGCSNTNQVTITILPTPTASFSASSQMGTPPLQVDFVNSSVNATDYNWLIDNDFQTNSNDFEFTFHTEGIFTVTLIASNDWCSDTASKIIHVALSTIGEIPNVFSPNNDGVNDLWEIEGVVKSVVILNRWGNVVFTSNENFIGWNGKDKNGNDCSDGVYFYRVEDGEGNYWVGFLTLLR